MREPLAFEVANSFGTGEVGLEEARAVFERWPAERRRGDLRSGFVVWDVSEQSGALLMATRYMPLEDAA